jgi:hypothetical protein
MYLLSIIAKQGKDWANIIVATLVGQTKYLGVQQPLKLVGI